MIGVIIVLIGVFKAVKMLAPVVCSTQKNTGVISKNVRLILAEYTLLALDFMVASDVIYTVLAHDMQLLLVLVGLVIIRTVLSYSLDRELKNAIRQE